MNKYIWLIGLVTSLMTPLSLLAIDLGSSQALGSFKFGRMAATDVKITSLMKGDRELRVGASRSLGIAFDFPLASHLLVGVGADVQNCYGGLLDLTVSLKGLIATPDGRFAFRPGIGFGGATSRALTLLTVRASGELQVSLSPQIGLGLEAGLWYTPSGGNELESVRIGPAKYLRAVVLVSSGTNQTVRPPRPVAVRRVQPVKPVQPKPDRTTDLAGSEPEQLPFQGVLKIGLSRCSKSAFRTVPTRKWFDRGLSLGVSADFTTPLLAFVGVEFGWHNLQRSESMLLGGFRGSFVSEIPLGSLRFRPVGLIGLGMRSRSGTMSERTDQMVYGLSLEIFWDISIGPPLLIDFQYLKFGRNSLAAGRWSELKSLISLRLGVTL